MSTNLEINKNADYTRTFTILDTNNTVINLLTGFSLAAQLRRNPLAVANASFEMTIVNAAAGKVRMYLPSSVTNTLDGKYMYDIFLTDPSNYKFKIEDGLITINPNITH
jgi:hypothetical protein